MQVFSVKDETFCFIPLGVCFTWFSQISATFFFLSISPTSWSTSWEWQSLFFRGTGGSRRGRTDGSASWNGTVGEDDNRFSYLRLCPDVEQIKPLPTTSVQIWSQHVATRHAIMWMYRGVSCKAAFGMQTKLFFFFVLFLNYTFEAFYLL